MTTGKWWVVWSGKNVGVTHAARKPKGIAQGPFPSKIAAVRAGRRALLRFRVSGKLPNPPKSRGRLSPTKRRRLSRMEFFQKFAGHIVGQRAQNALDLARAEEYAEKHGWRWQEIPEQERYEDVYGEPGDPRAEYVTVVLTDGENGPVLASLGFVDFNDQDYVRVVRAELALEVMSNKRNPGRPTRAARRFISSKIQRLAHEGMAAPRRIGAAYNMARARGFKVPRTNPPLRDLQVVGPNQTELFHGNLRVFYSYNRPVAIVDVPKHIAYRTTQHYSNTTSRHVNKWLRSLGYGDASTRGALEYLPQEQIDMAAMVGSIDYAKHEALARELDNPSRRRL